MKAPWLVGLTRLTCLFATSLLIASCSSGELKKLMGKESSSEESKEEKMVDVTISLTPRKPTSALWSGDAFSLVSATAVKFDVTTCASGYSISNTTANATSVAVKLYAHDRGCLAELEEFAYGGKTYTKVGGGTLSAGSATFEHAVSGSKFYVSVVAQLPDPLTDAATASFAFHELTSATHAISDYSFSETLEVKGVRAPNFDLPDVELISIDAADGAATFTFTAECAIAMTQNGGGVWQCESAGGDQQLVTDMKVKLIWDDPGTYTGHEMTYAQAEAAMAAGTTNVTNVMKVAGPNNRGAIQFDLEGPGQLYAKKEMFLIISYTDATYGTSYKYFSVTIGDPQ